MRQEIRQAYIARITTELSEVLTGNNFEQFGYLIADFVFSDYDLSHRGTNTSGAPVKAVVDSFSSCGKAVAESSTEKNYFDNLKKIDKDTLHAVEHYKETLEKLLLLSNRVCPPGSQKMVTKYVNDILDSINVEIIVKDARSIAEIIVDELLFDEGVTERISHYLPSVQRIRSESILNFTLPKMENNYEPRSDVEDYIKGELLNEKSLIVTGFSGIGKSNLSCAIAHKINEEFDIALWIDGSELNSIEELGSYDVYRNGHHMNLLGLLKSKKCLLVIDNINLHMSSSVLDDYCGSGSVILASRQEKLESSDYELPLLDDMTSRNILEYDLSLSCPDDIFKKIYELVGGYPLIYGLMNTNMRYSGYEWDDLALDCDAITEYEDDKNLKLTERLLGHLLKPLENQLSFLKSCKGKLIDLEFARYILKPIGINKLERSTIITKSSCNFLKIHDVIFTALGNLEILEMDLTDPLCSFLKKQEKESWEGFLRVSYRHRALVNSLYNQTKNNIFLYAFLIATAPNELSNGDLPDLKKLLDDVRGSGGEEQRIAIITLIEVIETKYLIDKDENIENARKNLDSELVIFDEFQMIVENDVELKNRVKHHYAKALQRIERTEEAEKIFQELSRIDRPMREAQLQLARIFARSDRGEEAKEIIEEILNSWDAENSASISVVLSAFEIVSRRSMKDHKVYFNNQYSDLISSIIKNTMAFGYDHAYRAFAVFSSDWSYHYPDKFMEAFESLPLPEPHSVSDDYLKSSIGDIYKDAGKIKLREQDEKARDMFGLAIEFYESIKNINPFHQRRLAEVYHLYGDHQMAVQICEELLQHEKPDKFVYFWLSKAKLALAEYDQALKAIDTALDKLTDRELSFKSTFLDVKSDILFETGESDYEDVLKEAIKCCETEKYQGELQNKLDRLNLAKKAHE